MGRIEKVFDFIDSFASVMVTNRNEVSRVAGREQQVTHQIRTGSRVSSQTRYKVMDQSGYVFLVLPRQIRQIDRRCDDKDPQWPYLLTRLKLFFTTNPGSGTPRVSLLCGSLSDRARRGPNSGVERFSEGQIPWVPGQSRPHLACHVGIADANTWVGKAKRTAGTR